MENSSQGEGNLQNTIIEAENLNLDQELSPLNHDDNSLIETFEIERSANEELEGDTFFNVTETKCQVN